jgi:hypothetical protein
LGALVFESEVVNADRPLWVAIENLHELMLSVIEVRIHKCMVIFVFLVSCFVQNEHALLVRIYCVFIELV